MIVTDGMTKRHNDVNRIIERLGLRGKRSYEKFVPPQYLYASPADRLELLRGLADSDGTAGSAPDIVTTSSQLADDIEFLVQSLGGNARRSVKIPRYKGRGNVMKDGRLAYRVGLHMPVESNPFRLRRKADAWRAPFKYPPYRTIVSIEPEGIEKVVCISVDAADRLYVTEDFIVTHNTIQAIAAMAVNDSDRAVIVVPPVTLTNWTNEIERCGLAARTEKPKRKPTKAQARAALAAAEARMAAGLPPAEPEPTALERLVTTPGKVPRELVVFRAGRKEPEIPQRGVILIPDSLLTGRSALRDKIIAWRPDAFAYDEAHRARTWASARSEAAREVTGGMAFGRDLRVAITATPVFSNPSDLASLLAITGHLDTVFGGYAAFIDRYCKRDHFNRLIPNKATLPELHRILADKVWVRRKKAEVLADLPPLLETSTIVDIDLATYQQAHEEVIATITDWVDDRLAVDGEYPDGDEVEAWAKTQIGLISPLRLATGVAKIPELMSRISAWIDSEVVFSNGGRTFACERPLLVWVHHQEVMQALVNHINENMKELERPLVQVIRGATSAGRRGEIVAEFQAGKVPILICSITAAGVGITLTYGSDQIFMEADYLPPVMSQAVDRQVRIGQKNHVHADTLLANDTLDARIQEILRQKAETIREIMGDDQGLTRTTVVESANDSPSKIVEQLALIAIDRHRRQRSRSAIAA